VEIWRLIRDADYHGIDNMAIDKAICLACGEGNSITTLRLYGWKNPTLSIGYNQKLAEIDCDFCKASSIDIIRRPTGGKAVLHEDEVTFSVASSLDNKLFPKTIPESHKKISLAILEGLRELGIDGRLQEKSLNKIPKDPNCFAIPSIYELTLNGEKIVGSAQRRYRKSFLEHGSAKLKINHDRLSRLFFKPCLGEFSNNPILSNEPEPMAGICDFPQNNFTKEQIKDSIISGFEKVFGIRFDESLVNDYELVLAKKHKDEYLL
jgi:lipoate-protein ligase A